MKIKLFPRQKYFRYFFNGHLLRIFNLNIFCYNFIVRSMNTKPPNILIYTGCNSSMLYKEIFNNLQKCLQYDRYTIYHLLESEVNTQPWMENCLLLIISSEVVKTEIAELFETYFKKHGNILLICSKFNDSFIGSKCFQISNDVNLASFSFKEIGNVILYRAKYSYDTGGTVLCYDSTKKPLLHKVIWKENALICSEIYLDRDPVCSSLPSSYNSNDRLPVLKCILSEEFGLEVKSDHSIPQLTSGIYVSKNEFDSTKLLSERGFAEPLEKCLFYEVKLNHFDKLIELPIFKNSYSEFNLDMYYSKLFTDIYGHQLIHFPVITSTMDVVNQFSDYEGIVVIAGCQISGRGRGSNQWISPEGCAMFSLHLTISLSSQLSKKLSLLQLISSLAVVHGIRNQPEFKNLELKVKWPNDIYYKEIKLGGLLVTSVIQNDTTHVYIGWGINVGNSYPTTCLNDVIDKHNSNSCSSLPHLHVEEVIAYTLSQMEYFVKKFNECGPDEIFTLYYYYWMHADQEVTVKNLNEEGIVIGLDDYGFLKIKTKKGEILTLHPDGNHFDIMKNLISST